MINLDKIKMVLFDFDDTLCIHPKHGKWDVNYLTVSITSGVNVWDHCSPNRHMQVFINLLKERGIPMGLLSATEFFPVMKGKNDWVEREYGVVMENYCKSDPFHKIKVLEAICEAFEFAHDEVAIVDDFYEVTDRASNEGFVSLTPMQVVNYIENINS